MNKARQRHTIEAMIILGLVLAGLLAISAIIF